METIQTDNAIERPMTEAKTSLTEAEIKEWLKPVEDPELFLSIVDLGLVYTCDFNEGNVKITMTLTSPGCPAGDYIIASLKERAIEHDLIKDADIEIVWEPAWDPKEMATEEVKDELGIW